MQRSLFLKLATILGLCAVLVIPLSMIEATIYERQGMRAHVLQDIARSSSSQQHLAGPILVVPYVHTRRERYRDPASGQEQVREEQERGQCYFLPEELHVGGTLKTEERFRGIYSARLFHGQNHVSARFRLPANLGLGEDLTDYRLETPFISVGISDIRGIKNALTLQAAGTSTPFVPGSRLAFLGSGVHAPLAIDGMKEQEINLEFQLELLGTESFRIVPLGKTTQVSLRSNWPHPSFVGSFLPEQRELDAKGFKADWKTSFFSTDMETLLGGCIDLSQPCTDFSEKAFGVDFIDPVNHYVKTARSVKYGLLFLGLTFGAFFLHEILKRLPVHPIQYGLVGLALALFYLMLLSLSEHLPFTAAYAIASLSCVTLLGYYVRHILGNWHGGLAFGAMFSGLYGLLFLLLRSEDYALLMGSVLLFGILATVMVFTRKIDWYRLAPLPAATSTLLEPSTSGVPAD